MVAMEELGAIEDCGKAEMLAAPARPATMYLATDMVMIGSCCCVLLSECAITGNENEYK